MKEIVAVLFALTGTFLLLTNGNILNLQVPKLTIVWDYCQPSRLLLYHLSSEVISTMEFTDCRRLGNVYRRLCIKHRASAMANGLYDLDVSDLSLFWICHYFWNDARILVLYR